MRAKDFIYRKQIAWARRQPNIELELHGRGLDCGYVAKLEQNLFLADRLSAIESDFEKGDGNELKMKMRALHSSSALAVNMFDFWRDSKEKMFQIACACGFCRGDNRFRQTEIRFERKFPVFSADSELSYYLDENGDKQPVKSPNLDVVFANEKNADFSVYAVECKLAEPYSHVGKPLRDAYFNPELDDLWSDMSHLRSFAETLKSPEFKYLDAAQLVKHILGLKASSGRSGKKDFRLLYLWYDCFGAPSDLHRQEIDEFKRIARDDEIMFHAKTYQELLFGLYDKHYDADGDYRRYFDYMMNRYL